MTSGAADRDRDDEDPPRPHTSRPGVTPLYVPPTVPVYGLDPAIWCGERTVVLALGLTNRPATGLDTWWSDDAGGYARVSSEWHPPRNSGNPPYWPDTQTWARGRLVESVGVGLRLSRDGLPLIAPRQFVLPSEEDLRSASAALSEPWWDGTWQVDGQKRECRWWSDGRYVGAYGHVGEITVIVSATGSDLRRLRLQALVPPSPFPVDIFAAQSQRELHAGCVEMPLISAEGRRREAENRSGLGAISPVDPRDTTWEVDDPAYRVLFFDELGASEEYEVTDCDVPAVLAWAQRRAGERTYVVYALVRTGHEGPGLIRLAGSDPNRPG